MTDKKEDKLVFGYYLVAFADLLGQRERLKKLVALPTDPDGPEYKEFVQVAKETIGAVSDLQETCKNFFNSYTGAEEKSFLNHIPGFKKLNKSEIKFQHYSDGLVVYVPLRTDDGYSPIKGVYGALVACGGLCLLGLAARRPVRIGIAIGVAAELRESELYGKAVAEAYEAESYVAQYPRVVVSNEVFDYLDIYAKQPCAENDMVCKVESQMAQTSMKMLSRDYDGRIIVNYLGDFYRHHLMSGIDQKVFRQAYQYVNEQLKEFQKDQNTKLAFRYSLLHGYFFDHLGEINKNAS